MATELKDVMAYLLKHHEDAPSNTRLNNLVYLADWHQAVKYGRQITNIEWQFSQFVGSALYVRDIENVAADHKDVFSVSLQGDWLFFSLKDKSFQPQLSGEAKETLDLVIKETKNLSSEDFMERVNKTYPVKFFEPRQSVNLSEKAREYKQQKQ